MTLSKRVYAFSGAKRIVPWQPKKTLGQAFAKFAAFLVVEPYRRSTVLHRGVKLCRRCSPLPRQCGVPKCDHEHSSMQHTPSSAIDSAPTCTQYDFKIAKPCLHSYSLCLHSSSFNIAIHYVYILHQISYTVYICTLCMRYHFLSNMHLFIPWWRVNRNGPPTAICTFGKGFLPK